MRNGNLLKWHVSENSIMQELEAFFIRLSESQAYNFDNLESAYRTERLFLFYVSEIWFDIGLIFWSETSLGNNSFAILNQHYIPQSFSTIFGHSGHSDRPNVYDE